MYDRVRVCHDIFLWLNVAGKPSKGTAEEDLLILCVAVAAMEEWMQKYSSWKRFVMSTIVNEFMDIIKSVDDVTFKKWTNASLITERKIKVKWLLPD